MIPQPWVESAQILALPEARARLRGFEAEWASGERFEISLRRLRPRQIEEPRKGQPPLGRLKARARALCGCMFA